LVKVLNKDSDGIVNNNTVITRITIDIMIEELKNENKELNQKVDMMEN